MLNREKVCKDDYQPQPSHIWFIPQVLLEVEVVHVDVDETEEVGLGRVHPYERHYIYIALAKEIMYMNLIEKPLGGRSVMGLTSAVTTYRGDLGYV